MSKNGSTYHIVYPQAAKSLAEIAELDTNWNGNGAEKFAHNFLQRCWQIIKFMPVEPMVFPTANNSVQLEYEKDTGGYLEFEIHPDGKVEVYWIDGSDNETTVVLDAIQDQNKIVKMVEEFHQRNIR